MRCTKCNTEVPSSYMKCPSCGQGFHGINTPSSFDKPNSIPQQNAPYTQGTSSQNPANSSLKIANLGRRFFGILLDTLIILLPFLMIGLLIGLGLPVVVLCLVYTNVVSQNLSELENYNITNAEYGVKEQVIESARTLDYTTLILFVVLIYAFSASLLTIKKKNFSNYIYCTIISSILVVLAIFIYLLYAFVPFFNTADIGNINIQSEIREQQFFVDNQQDIANITTNSTQNSTLQKAFFVTFIFILLITIIFIYLSKTGPFFNGLLSSSAIIIQGVVRFVYSL